MIDPEFPILMLEAEVWEDNEDGELCLVEPFIEVFRKFDPNSGWVADSTSWPYLVMQALSHFSYHATAGKYVLCDLQGTVQGNTIILTDPVILSRDRSFGLTDLGPDGTSTFFSQHECNEYCHCSWTKPRRKNRLLHVQKGTTMHFE
eukprot:TRINITY_DN49756_c0_g1_i1.p1 TRINITY_DN49756_c0_g1~~TRINITY_DN49756_c0_g1_i1.p1  ORF type:complete len:147 (-),score=10.84 TRINITY_DN49756_c0_g1_i1:12-452(-)